MMYEVTFNFPANQTIKVNAEDKEDAFNTALDKIIDISSIKIEEKEEINGEDMLNTILDSIPHTDRILFYKNGRGDFFSLVYGGEIFPSAYGEKTQRQKLAECICNAFAEFAEDNIDEECQTAEGLFNYSMKKKSFGSVCSIYYEDTETGNFILAY